MVDFVTDDLFDWFIVSPVRTFRKLLGFPYFDNTTGKLNPLQYTDTRSAVLALTDDEGLLRFRLGGFLPYNFARYVTNLAAASDTPSTQNITTVSGNEYAISVEGADGSTAVFSNAAASTLTNNGTDRISTNSGVPLTAASTTLTVTITGAVTNLHVQDVTGRTDQIVGEYVSSTEGTAIYSRGNGGSVNASGIYTPGLGALLSPQPELVHVPGSTNKCTNFNLNPTDLTNVTKSGDVASVMTLIDDSVDLFTDVPKLAAKANGDVIRLNNSAGVAASNIDFGGSADNTNNHSAVAYIKADGSFRLRTTGSDIGTLINGTGGVYIEVSELFTSVTGVALLRVQANPGVTLTVIANQMNEGGQTPIIEVAGSSASRGDVELQAPQAGNFDATQGTVMMDMIMQDASQAEAGNIGIVSTRGSSNSVVSMSGTSGRFQSTDGANFPVADTSWNASDRIRVVVCFSALTSVMQVHVYNVTQDSWVHGTPTAFDGSYVTTGGLIEYFLSQTHQITWVNHEILANALGSNQAVENRYG